MNQDTFDAQKSVLKRDYQKRYLEATKLTHYVANFLNLSFEIPCCLLLYLLFGENKLLIHLSLLDGFFMLACDLLRGSWISKYYFSTRLCWSQQLLGYFVIFLHANGTNCGDKLNLGMVLFLVAFLGTLYFSIFWYKNLEIRYADEDHVLREENPTFDKGDMGLLAMFLLWRFIFVSIEFFMPFFPGDTGPCA